MGGVQFPQVVIGPGAAGLVAAGRRITVAPELVHVPRRRPQPRQRMQRGEILVPEGALGPIVRLDHVIDGDDLEVAWGRSGRRTPWIDWFTKAESEAHLIEVREPRGGKPPAARAEA